MTCPPLSEATLGAGVWRAADGPGDPAGGGIGLRPRRRNHVWSFRLVMGGTADGRAFRMLLIVDEYTWECLAIDVSRKLTSEDVLEPLRDLFVRQGVPDHIRSVNGLKFTATRVRE